MNYLHAFLGWTIVGLNAYAALNIISLNGVKTEGLHNNVGQICFYGLMGFAVSGTITFIIKKQLEWNTKYVILARKIHRFLAIIFWAFSLFVLTTGIANFVNNNINDLPTYGFLVPLNVILMVGITVVLEIFYQLTWRKEDPLDYGDKLMTLESFE